MIFTPNTLVAGEGRFTFGSEVSAIANACLDKQVMRELWAGSTYRSSRLEIASCDDFLFSIGCVSVPQLDGNLYAINITTEGVCIAAESRDGLIKGFMTLLDRIQPVELTADRTVLALDCCLIQDKPSIENRMVHFCVFPDTELWELHKFIRLCGALKYSHVVLEFWGMLQYDTMKELSWHHAFTKNQIRPILQEANDLGIEMIPMFNHWGHASSGRMIHGKHVVLDQNPRLQTLFSEDGWTWNIWKKEVRTLLRNIRQELIELCGEGRYFHLGCDEPYNFKIDHKSAEDLTDYLNEITEDLGKQGRRPIIWGDMFVARRASFHSENRYYASCPDEKTEKLLLNQLDKRIVIADWQYEVKRPPVETALIFASAGFDVVLCPWDRTVDNLCCCAETVKTHQLFGTMHTTWHTLSSGMPYVTENAILSWRGDAGCLPDYASCAVKTAALLRKVYFVDGDYTKAGWAKYEIGVNT